MRVWGIVAFIGSLVFSSLAVTVAEADDKAMDNYKRGLFLDSAIERLEDKMPSYRVKEVKSKALEWKIMPTERNWVEATDAVTYGATNYRVSSDVTIITFPNDAATIKYQTVGQRERNEPPKTAKGLTTCVETMVIGTYHIWAERKGQTTSNTDHTYEILKADEKIEISEDNERE